MAVSLALTSGLGAATVLVIHSDAQAIHAREHPADPLTSERAAAQTVDAVLDVVRAAGLRDPAGGYALRSCKNAQEPPYQTVVHMTFTLPQGNSIGYLDDVADAMHGIGWVDASSTAEHFGRKLTKSGLTSVFYRNPERLDLATMHTSGECRVVTAQPAAALEWTELTDRLRAPR